MAGTIIEETKKRQKRRVKERPKDEQPTGTKKRERELVPLVVGSYLTHCPSNLNYICIWNYKYQVQQDFGLVPHKCKIKSHKWLAKQLTCVLRYSQPSLLLKLEAKHKSAPAVKPFHDFLHISNKTNNLNPETLAKCTSYWGAHWLFRWDEVVRSGVAKISNVHYPCCPP